MTDSLRTYFKLWALVLAVFALFVMGAFAYGMLSYMTHNSGSGSTEKITLHTDESTQVGGYKVTLEFAGHHEKAQILEDGRTVRRRLMFAQLRAEKEGAVQKFELDSIDPQSPPLDGYMLKFVDAGNGIVRLRLASTIAKEEVARIALEAGRAHGVMNPEVGDMEQKGNEWIVEVYSPTHKETPVYVTIDAASGRVKEVKDLDGALADPFQ